MIDHKKAQILARTLATLSNMSAHIIVAGYFKGMTKDDDQVKQWEERIGEAVQAREAAIEVVAAMITDINKQPEEVLAEMIAASNKQPEKGPNEEESSKEENPSGA